MTVRKWCGENGINIKTFYNRMREVRLEMLDQAEIMNSTKFLDTCKTENDNKLMQQDRQMISKQNCTKNSEGTIFAALPIPQQKGAAAVTVRMDGYAVDIQNGADDIIIEQVLRLVTRL
jgi:hypothetical protein